MSAAARLRAQATALRAHAEASAAALEAEAQLLEQAGEAWLTLDEAAERARVTVRVLRDAGRRREVEVGRGGRVRVAEIDRWLASTSSKRRPLATCAANDLDDLDEREQARRSLREAATRIRGSR